MKVAIYTRELSKGLAWDTFKKVIAYLAFKKIEVCLHKRPAASAQKLGWNTGAFELFETCDLDSDNNPDLIISIGGDGTMLDTLTVVKDTEIPVLGINTGRLGFLSATGTEGFESAIEAFLTGNYMIDPRSVIELKTSAELFTYNYALNDFVINKKDSSSMMTVHTYLNGEYFNSYWADGLICSSPTGSTGYNLSCGGPILHPKSGSFAITPIAPHNLNVRPFVIPDDHVLAFEIEGRSTGFLASLDARSVTITPHIQMAIKRADFSFHLVRLKGENFMNTLRKKMLWGMDSRN